MIVTLTANPSLDKTIRLEAPLRPGEVQAALESREDAGGKGINVSRVVSAAGGATLAVLPLAPQDPFDASLRATRIPAHPVPVTGHARSNVTITDPSGTTTKLNLPGVVLEERERSAVIDAVVRQSEGSDWLVLAGSLPPGAGDDFYVDVVHAVRVAHRDRAPRIAVDTSGPALSAVVERAAPDLIKPNDDEIVELTGIELGAGVARSALLAVARTLVPLRVRAALVTLGADGAVLVTADGAWAGTPPRIRVASTVGAGDSSLAGYLLAETAGSPPEECLRTAILYGAAAASLPGTQAPRPLDLPDGDVTVEQIA